jgi:hypothetical protein
MECERTTRTEEVNDVGSRPRTIYYPIDESIELTRREILFQPKMDFSVLLPSSNAAKVVFDVEYNSSIPSSMSPRPPSAQQSQPGSVDVDRDDEAANILVLLQNAGHKDDANDDDDDNNSDGNVREEGEASSSDKLGINSNSVSTAIDRSPPPPPDTMPTGISSEMTRLRQELEMLRSERDHAVIELKHLKTQFDDAVVATERNNDLKRLESMEATSRGDRVSNNDEVLMLRMENEESKRKLLEASTRIATLSAEKITLVTRINDALGEARSTITAALNCSITHCDDDKIGTINDYTNNNKATHQPHLDTTRHDESVMTSITTINDHTDPPQPRKRSNDSRPTKGIRFSSSSSCSSHGSGRVSFDRSTSFGNTKLPKFDIFNENFSNRKNNKKQKMKKKNTKLLSFGHNETDTTEDGSGYSPSNDGLVSTQSSTRRKKYSTSNASKGNSNLYSLDSFADDKLY